MPENDPNGGSSVLSRVVRGILLVSAVLMSVMLVAPTASAATSDAPPKAEQSRVIAQRLDDIAKSNPGTQKTDATTLKLANGIVVTMTYDPTPAAKKPITGPAALTGGPGCSYLWLCIWDDPGYKLSFTNCGFVNIGSVYGWSDRLREVQNNQTTGTYSTFYNWTGSSWGWVGSVPSPHYTGYISPPDAIRTTDAITVC